MRRLLSSAAWVTAGFLAAAGARASAQGYIPPTPVGIAPITNPVYSPYLNLLRPGGTFTQNYFGLVRPELEFRNASGVLQQQIYRNDQYLNGLSAYGTGGYLPLITGHNATVLNLGGHFLNRNPPLPRSSLLSYGGGYGDGSVGYYNALRNAANGGAGLPGAYGAYGAFGLQGGIPPTGGPAARGIGPFGGLQPGVPAAGGVGYPAYPR